jgi:3-methyl-2-oxobutanoate hydroxymethyltransferase
VNLTFSQPAKFVRQYGDAANLFRDAIDGYRQDVEKRAFPTDSESYHLPKEVASTFDSSPVRQKA